MWRLIISLAQCHESMNFYYLNGFRDRMIFTITVQHYTRNVIHLTELFHWMLSPRRVFVYFSDQHVGDMNHSLGDKIEFYPEWSINRVYAIFINFYARPEWTAKINRTAICRRHSQLTDQVISLRHSIEN